jgi:integrase
MPNEQGVEQWHARFTRADGTRTKWLPLDPRIAPEDEARRCAATLAAQVTARTTAAAGVETCDGWHERYLKFCAEQGMSTVQTKRDRWHKWISPTIGAKPPGDVTRDDIENVRDALDEAIRAYNRDGAGDGRLAPKTAQNAWSELTVSFREMVNSKRRDLRTIQADPTQGVQPPERGTDKGKCYPYPSELLAVVSCEDIPRDWREVHAVSAYTYARPGELMVLEWSDVDLDDQRIRITKAWDYENERVKSTKTHESRDIPIEPALLPLLRVMKERADGKGLVLPVLAAFNNNKLAILMRRHFTLAKCNRARLAVRSTAELRLRFRSWRDAGITWSIVRGDDIVKVQRRAGHKLISTTQRYIVEAENRGATFGTPFPPLPACLVGGISSSKRHVTILSASLPVFVVPEKGIETGLDGAKSIVQSTTYETASTGISSPNDGIRAPSLTVETDAKTVPATIEDALAGAVGEAARAGRWDVVAQLARELEARRVASAGVPTLDDRRSKPR